MLTAGAAGPADLRRATRVPTVRQRVAPDSVVITDGLGVSRPAEAGGDTLGAEGFEPERCSHSDSLVQYGPGGAALHVNGIEKFWSQAKRRRGKDAVAETEPDSRQSASQHQPS